MEIYSLNVPVFVSLDTSTWRKNYVQDCEAGFQQHQLYGCDIVYTLHLFNHSRQLVQEGYS